VNGAASAAPFHLQSIPRSATLRCSHQWFASVVTVVCCIQYSRYFSRLN